jgi:hypothetical protein
MLVSCGIATAPCPRPHLLIKITVYSLGFRFDSKILISLVNNLLDGEHEEQPLQWLSQQHPSQQWQ